MVPLIQSREADKDSGVYNHSWDTYIVQPLFIVNERGLLSDYGDEPFFVVLSELIRGPIKNDNWGEYAWKR